MSCSCWVEVWGMEAQSDPSHLDDCKQIDRRATTGSQPATTLSLVFPGVCCLAEMINPYFALTDLDWNMLRPPFQSVAIFAPPFQHFLPSHGGKQLFNNSNFSKQTIVSSIASWYGSVNNNMLLQHLMWTTCSHVLAHKLFMLQVIILTT